jgi:putative transcriptional regulator
MARRSQLVTRRGSMTHAEVARRAGISRAYYTQIELGARRPSLPLAQRLAEVFGATMEDLFFDRKGTAR